MQLLRVAYVLIASTAKWHKIKGSYFRQEIIALGKLLLPPLLTADGADFSPLPYLSPISLTEEVGAPSL